jgi:type IV fimbrial biogenesis protein FimT
MLELLVAISIIGILLSVGFVNLRPERFAVNQAATGLAAQVSRARLEAIKHNRSAGLRVVTTGNGFYQVWVDLNNNGAFNDGEAIHTVTLGQGDHGRVRLASSTVSSFMFDTRGVPLTPAGGTITLSDRSGTYQRSVVINTAGRAVVQ